MTRQLFIWTVSLALSACSTIIDKKELEPNLYADREAPIGWVYFKAYPDSTFEYSLSKRDINKGTFKLRGDTLHLIFADTSIHLDRAVIVKDRVEFISSKDTNYTNSATINFNKLTKK